MKVAEQDIIGIDQRFEVGRDTDCAKTSGLFYAAKDAHDLELEHDARGLIMAIVLCMACWAALGFFLLS
ncbi:hypothetical protein GCM10011349_16600 [Novosphingobium indicum]|jgi:hypothetical protein|uniref:Uncharacterized protein n=1 Tax=Novosphingobium indicum TaxID=462949 RepID=A0ABQ2JKN8_9SPHN|nr:hypothetical protein [Novosphingobium indicum]GGN47800.1 hypothetical protein GCM10011349_16600 [Novosphingobium indicum]|tara:strand:+ start:2621 stop:2827 length:207 start_codon:yes stop_codon:yes gene_type:complete